MHCTKRTTRTIIVEPLTAQHDHLCVLLLPLLSISIVIAVGIVVVVVVVVTYIVLYSNPTRTVQCSSFATRSGVLHDVFVPRNSNELTIHACQTNVSASLITMRTA